MRFGLDFRWKKGRGNTRIHIYRPNTMFSGRKSRDTRLIRLGQLRIRLGHGKRKKVAADMQGPLVSEARERKRAAAAAPRPAHASAREKGRKRARLR
jgi:hypothetical protein